MKVAIIRCMQTEDYCPATIDFLVIKERKGAFEGVEEDIDIIGINSCGGCPGKKAVLRAKEMVKRGADTIVFASCISKGNPIGFPCPFAKRMMESVKTAIGEEIRILEYTH
jgi:predicted metal-binding protein